MVQDTHDIIYNKVKKKKREKIKEGKRGEKKRCGYRNKALEAIS
jgi:hypothetical protein